MTRRSHARPMPWGFARALPVGIVIGVVLGVVVESLAIGIAAGIALAFVLARVFGPAQSKKGQAR